MLSNHIQYVYNCRKLACDRGGCLRLLLNIVSIMLSLISTKTQAALLCYAFSLILPFSQGQTIPEISATYGSAPALFKLDVHSSFIAITTQKVKSSRIANDIGVPNLVDGPSTATAASVKNFWVHDFDWWVIQEQFNQK